MEPTAVQAIPTDPAIWYLGGAFIIDRIFNGLKARGINLQVLNKQIQDLHEWHKKTDDDGVKVWYIRKSLQDSIAKLADSISVLNMAMHDIHNTSKQQTQILTKLLDKMG